MMRKITLGLFIAFCINFIIHSAIAADIREVQGITEPYKDSTLSSTVAGVVSVIHHKEGEFVKQGEIILELENEQEKLEVDRRKLISESKVELNAAEIRSRTLKENYENTLKVFEATASVSREELQKNELEYKLAEAEYQGYRIAEEREAIEYKIAKAQLEKRKIAAPFDGVVVKIFLETGEGCAEQQPLVRIVDIRQCRFIAYMDATASKNLKKSDSVVLKIAGNSPATEFPGKVEYVSSVVDPSSSLREVKVLFDNPNFAVPAGVSASMSLIGEK